MTARDFVDEHPDSAEWTAADIETFQNLHDIDDHTPPTDYAPAA